MIDEIAHWAFQLKYNDIPQRVVEKAKLQILNIISAVLSGRYHDSLKFISSLNLPDGKATILTLGKKTTAEYCAFVNALYSMSFDFDDYLFMGHTGHSSVLTSFAIAEEHNLTISDIILAQIIANEVEGRLGASVLIGPHNGQMWSFIHAIGSAICASKLLDLSQKQMASAIALSLYQPNFPLTPGFMTSDLKLITASLPIMSGILCAKLARLGMEGNTIVSEIENAFFSKFSYLPLPHMFSGFSQWWVTDTIAFKPYPGCAYIDTTIDNIYQIMNMFSHQTGRYLEPEDISNIDIFANILTIGMNTLSEMYDDGTLNPVNINFSIPKSVAVTLVNHALSAEHLSYSMLSRSKEKILFLKEKIKLYHDWYFTMKMQASFFESIGSGFLLSNISTLKLLKAFRIAKKDLPTIRLHMPGLLKAWTSLTQRDKMVIKNGLRRKNKYINMDRFIFSFGSRVKLETKDNKIYEAESITPYGASPLEQKDVVLNKLSFALKSGGGANELLSMLDNKILARDFINRIITFLGDK